MGIWYSSELGICGVGSRGWVRRPGKIRSEGMCNGVVACCCILCKFLSARKARSAGHLEKLAGCAPLQFTQVSGV